jgi:NAD(P)-dependent dehydrogenase (short-subunit alcohol dehydrogenase family)
MYFWHGYLIVPYQFSELLILGDCIIVSNGVCFSAETKKAYGKVDILVNNARVYAFSPIETLTSGSINAMFSVNVFGLMRRPRQRYRYSPRRVEASSILAM